MTTTENINIDDLIEKIINNPPSPAKTYNLMFDDFDNVKNVFEFCMEVFTKLSVAKFGNAEGKVNVSTWNDKTIQLFAEYFASFGFKLNIIITLPTDPNMSIYNSMRYDVIQITPTTHLSSIVYILKHPATNYIIYFDYL